MGVPGLFSPSPIAVGKNAYIYWFAYGLWGILWNGFFNVAVEPFSVHSLELLVVNVKICWVHTETRVVVQTKVSHDVQSSIHVTFMWQCHVQ